MRLLNSNDTSCVSGGFASLNIAENKLIVSLAYPEDCLVLKMNDFNIFTFNLGKDGMVECSYVINSTTYLVDREFNIFNGHYGLFGMPITSFTYSQTF